MKARHADLRCVALPLRQPDEVKWDAELSERLSPAQMGLFA